LVIIELLLLSSVSEGEEVMIELTSSFKTLTDEMYGDIDGAMLEFDDDQCSVVQHVDRDE
jgi:hypothetical protein